MTDTRLDDLLDGMEDWDNYAGCDRSKCVASGEQSMDILVSGIILLSCKGRPLGNAYLSNLQNREIFRTE